MRASATTLALAVAVAVTAAGAAGSRPTRATTPSRCCFMVSVDAAGEFTDDYRGTASSQWTGVAFGGWAWSTRFIVGYTGRGVAPVGGRALEDVRSYSADAHAVLLQPIPPATQLRKKQYHCPANFVPGPGGGSVGLGPGSFKPIGTGSLIAAARNIGGYHRALVVSTPAHIGFECHPLAGEEPGQRAGAIDLAGPDAYTVRAPSVDSFLGGQAFGRSCWQTVVADLPNPFPHHYIYEAYLGVQFTYFPKGQLAAKERALAGLAGSDPKDSAAARRAHDAMDQQQGTGQGCR